MILFFSGQPYVSNKDKITQPSSPYRHSVELVHLNKGIPQDDPKPVLVILSDGGPDHKLDDSTFFQAEFGRAYLYADVSIPELDQSSRTSNVHSEPSLTERLFDERKNG